MAKRKNKPTSIRLPENLLQDIDQKCEDLDCSRNDYIISVLDENIINSRDEGQEQSQTGLDNSNKPAKEVYID